MTTATQALPGFLESVRVADRALLDVARTRRLRPMEAYLLLIMLDEGDAVSTAHIAARVAASSSQAKQLALALQVRGLITRRDRTGLTSLTPEGRALLPAAMRLNGWKRAEPEEFDDVERTLRGEAPSSRY